MSWPTVPLGDLAEFINGVAFAPEDWGESGLKIIRIQNLTSPDKPYNRSSRIVADRFIAKPGDLLVSWSATLGVFEWKGEEDGAVNQHIFRVVPRELIDKGFLRHSLQGAIQSMQRHLHGATMQHVNRGEFLNTRVPVPPIGEQRRIAAILDKADELCAKRRAALALLETLPQAIFLEMFGDPLNNPMAWPTRRLGQILRGIDSGWSPICLERPKADDEWGVLKLGAITSGEFRPLENKALPEGVEPKPAVEVRAGDLLFTRKNTYELVAATALVRSTPARLMMSDLIFRLDLVGDYRPAAPYFHQLMMNPGKRKQIQRLAGGSSGSMPNIPKSKLEQVLMPLPPIGSLNQFVARIEAIGKIKVAHQSALAEHETLLSSLQARAFGDHRSSARDLTDV